MAAMSRGLATKPRVSKSEFKKPKGGTPSSRRHHFESFSQRITKLKIEPIRRGRSTILDDAELDTTFSYFKTSLDEWRELNLSETFTAFARKVGPLCESLPQILHYNDRILDLLVEYIEKGDTWSEEALLSLMSHFAHDLGVKFEKHFQRAVKAVSQLAAKHQDVEVIEWSFTCLAWLFKYLSRLLVSDLRPLFDLMAPLLGQEHQKPFVTRFAAESLSFLVRKAGAVYHRDQEPLKLVSRHVSEQLEALQDNGKEYEFQQGLMSLFADSMKGVQRGLHSSATAILQQLLLQTYSEDVLALRSPPMEPVLTGVIISLIHHSDAETFEPLLHSILHQAKVTSSDARFIGLSSRLLFTACSVRKGSRISSWKPILEALNLLINTADKTANLDSSDKQDILSAAAVMFQYCSLDVAIPHVQILERFSKGVWEHTFLPFCNLFADLGAERFKTLLLPFFKRFIAQKATEYESELCMALPNLYRKGALPKNSVQLPKLWYENSTSQFRALAELHTGSEDNEQIPYFCNAFLEAAEMVELPVDIKHHMSRFLLKSLEKAVHIRQLSDVRPADLLAAGQGFRFLVQQSELQDALLKLWPSLCEVSPVFGHYLLFWQSLLSLAERSKGILDFSSLHHGPFHDAVMRCLSSPSHDMRLAALSILEIIANKDEKIQNIIATAMMIEQTPLDLENARAISMRIRQLAKSYPSVTSDEWVCEAIPNFCFGLLHVRLAQVWDDTCSALKDICDSKDGEAHVSRIAFDWLAGAETQQPLEGNEDTAKTRQYATQFQCTNIMQLEQIIARNQGTSESLEQHTETLFTSHHTQLPFKTSFSRTQSLRLLNIIPQVAEKQNRLVVPVLLQWVSDQPALEVNDDHDTGSESDSADAMDNRWTRKDQKSLLTLFSHFHNPKVLFRSNEVYDALLLLLGNGEVEIQKAALKAILTWKDAAISRYQENLFNLLDDVRFREEISVFMDVSDEDSHLQENHRDQLLPVILRLLYGKVISGRRGQEAKRKAVFIALTRFDAEAIRHFLAIAFGPLSGISIVNNEGINEVVFAKELMSPRKQLGMLNMLEDMLDTLKTTLTPFASVIVEPLLYCLMKASRGLSTLTPTGESEEENIQSTQLSLLRTIRQRGFHSLNILFESYPEFSWNRFMPAIVEELISPRLNQFPVETAQSVSGVLRLFAAWSSSLQTALFLAEFNEDILPKVIECLHVPSAKDDVKRFVLDNVLRRLIETAAIPLEDLSAEDRIRRSRIHSKVVQPYATTILSQVGELLRKSPSKELLESGVYTVAELAPHVAGIASYRSLIEISTFLLRQPSKRVNSQTKLGLLKILHEFIPRCDSKDLEELFDTIFDAICSPFSFYHDRVARSLLCELLENLAGSVQTNELQTVANLCQDLNSFSASRLDEPDFDRRLNAFNTINQGQSQAFSLLQWRPIVYNMLYYIKDNDELSIRVNASLSLRRFVDASIGNDDFMSFMSSVLLPGIQNGMREASELVRTEFLAVLAHLVHIHRDWSPIADLHVLLGADDESSIFTNILHIQGHRRLRALRRLASTAPQLQANNIYHILVPLLEQFIFHKAEDEAGHNLSGEAIRTVAALADSLDWPQFRSMLKRFIGYLTSKEDMQKTIIKLLAGMMDSLNRAGRAKGYTTSAPIKVIENEPEGAEDATMELDEPLSTLTKSLPAQEKLTNDLTGNILPPLTQFLHNKDESTVSLRVPIAIAVVKVLLVLPPAEIETRLPSVLLDICHILKSRSQDGRDMSRNTLSEIATLTGPTYLGFILKAMRIALQRGYQLHVLSFTLHHILVKMAPDMKPGDLDYCLPEIVDVIMDDIFGVTGQEKDAEEYISKMKEVKSSKSYDSMDLVARTATAIHLVDLIQPIKFLLLEKLNARMVGKIDELLRRVGLGILQNPAVKDRDILIFCYELIQDVYKASEQPKTKEEDSKNRRYLINMRGAAKSGARGSTSSYIYKITRFSLDILRTVLKKHEDLQTPQNLAGFVPIIGDALVQGQEEVQISAIRLLTTIIKVPLSALDKDCPVYATEAVRVIKGAPSSNTEVAQASLKMISAILKERPNVTIKERDIATLLKRMIPDLDQPDRQGITFGFLKAVMNRKIVIPEIYEVMDKVAALMVTNQTKSVRDLARASYFHFLMEYPQAKNRFTKQLEFLIRNLRYDYVEGRQSVMEALNLILSKVGDNILQDVLGIMFIPLVHSMANDDSADCRTMAGALVKKLFERADAPRLKDFTSDLRNWLEQDEDAGLKRLGIQCWGLYFEAVDEIKPKELAFLIERLQSTSENALARRSEDDWELVYYSLTVFSKLCKTAPESTLTSNQRDFWKMIQSCISYPHAWVKLTAAKLLGTFFSDLASANGDAGLDALPLESSRGLELGEEDMIKLTNTFLKNLSMPNITEDMCAQSVRNLAFLSRCLAVNGAMWKWRKFDEDEDVDDHDGEEVNGKANGIAISDEEFGGFSPPPEKIPELKGDVPTAIHRLIVRLSGIVRRETKIMRLTALYPKTAVMTLLETLVSKLPIDSILSSLPHLLTTLSTLTDPATSIPRSTEQSFNDAYKSLIDKAREILSILQKRMGTEQYLATMGEVQKGVKQRREERRTKRKVEAITNPEKYGQDKRRRHMVEKARKKEKAKEERGRRRGW
jgi:U3 small nucleolar RNA-associated protein 20